MILLRILDSTLYNFFNPNSFILKLVNLKFNASFKLFVSTNFPNAIIDNPSNSMKRIMINIDIGIKRLFINIEKKFNTLKVPCNLVDSFNINVNRLMNF